MIKRPDMAQWDTSALEDARRTYLEAGLSFEQIAARVIESAQIVGSKIEPYNTAPRGEKDGRQIIFVVRAGLENCDLLYNAPDGLRGRYWQSPDHGFAATKDLIGQLLHRLLDHARDHPPSPPNKCAPMNAEDIRASLAAVSSKVWPQEKDEARNDLFADDQLKVLRWKQYEMHGGKGRSWRRSPITGDLEIKGALIGADRTEYVPDSKRDRSCQIHKFGYT